MNELVYPFWRMHVTRVEEGTPLPVKKFLTLPRDVYSREGVREFLRFFLHNALETEKSSPIELEILRVTHEDSLFFREGREVTDRAVYHVDFRLPLQRDLIGVDHIQNEIIGAWISIGGQFIHRVTHYDDRGRPIRYTDRVHRPISKEYTE